MPSVILSDISVTVLKSHRLCEKIHRFFDDFLCDSQAETFYLLLGHNLLLLLEQQANEHIVAEEVLSIDKTDINFKFSHLKNHRDNFVKEIAALNESLLSWDEMEELIRDCAKGSQPLFVSKANSARTTIKGLMEDLLINEGVSREKEAYLAYSGKIRIISGTGRKSISGLLNNFPKCDMPEAISSLLQFKDMGVVSTNVRIYDGKIEYCCRPDTQSLFVYARRFANDLPVLISMENDCVWNKDEILKRIARFYSDNQAHIKNITRFVETLYSVGHRIRDWDINFFKWTEISESVRNQCKNKDEMLRIQMFIDAGERIQLMEKYRNMFD